MRNKMKNQNPIFSLLGIVLILSIGFTILSSNKQNTLEVYNNSDIVKQEEITTEEKQIDTFIYENEKYGFTIEIPSNWEKVIKDGYDTFIHPASSSSIQIQVQEYDPIINQTSADVLSTQVVDNGYSFVNYTRLTNYSYELLYQDTSNNPYDYIEEVYWNKNAIVKLKCVFYDKNYPKILPYYTKSFESFLWYEPNKDDYRLIYSSVGDFEFAIPSNWVCSTSGNAIVCANPDNTAQLVITLQESNQTLESLTATDMTHIISSGRNGFVLKDFNTSHTKAIAYAMYNNGSDMRNKTYLIANGFYTYSFQYDYVNGAIDEIIIDNSMELFREFVSKKIIEDSETVTNKVKVEESSSIEQATAESTSIQK